MSEKRQGEREEEEREEKKARGESSAETDPRSDVEPGPDCDCGLEQEDLVLERANRGRNSMESLLARSKASCRLGMGLDHSRKDTGFPQFRSRAGAELREWQELPPNQNQEPKSEAAVEAMEAIPSVLDDRRLRRTHFPGR